MAPKTLLHGPVVGDFEKLFEHYSWARDRVLREEGIRSIHFLILRMSHLRGGVSRSELERLTGLPKSDLTKAQQLLLSTKMVEIRKQRRKRWVVLLPTGRGKKRLKTLEAKILQGWSELSRLEPNDVKSFGELLSRIAQILPTRRVEELPPVSDDDLSWIPY